ncbi:MAG: DNA-processing protein DprA, partial [Neisseria sp.]|nr:DNA-processing protein DprA [Neisseria sp.]MBP8043220.1 DNA-processing protein DprA [Neisseria sp.]
MERNEHERLAWLQLAFTPYIGAESFLALHRHFGSARAALAAPVDAVRGLLRQKQALRDWGRDNPLALKAVEAALNWEAQPDCRLMLLSDEDFPLMLTEGITPPPVLFLRGNTALLQRPAVAVVGSRHATPQALRIARDFGEAISEQEIAVVSGMAAGIDAAAHQGALAGAGGTIAVWGTGIDRIYPPANKNLAYQIAERGLIVSEFPLDTRPLAGNFPRRNRIIAALAQAVLVVEAAPESGSLITAKLAAEMGREVMAVPGSIDNPHSKGCHKLIKEGAKLVECLDDILQECPQLLQKAPVSSYSIYKETDESSAKGATEPLQTADRPSETADESGKDELFAAMGYDPVHPDSLAQSLGLPAADVYARLLELELDGQIAAMTG